MVEGTLSSVFNLGKGVSNGMVIKGKMKILIAEKTNSRRKRLKMKKKKPTVKN